MSTIQQNEKVTVNNSNTPENFECSNSKSRSKNFRIIFIFILSLILIIFNNLVATKAFAATNGYTSTVVNVRSGPGTNYKVLRKIPGGGKVSVDYEENGWSKLSDSGWIKSSLLYNSPADVGEGASASGTGKWIEYDVSSFCVYLHSDGSVIWSACNTSNGKTKTPTKLGDFKVTSKVAGPKCMYPPGDKKVCNVKWITYWHSSGYAFHEAWWMGSNINKKISHGCVNMTTDGAKKVYDFAKVGMRVWVHK